MVGSFSNTRIFINIPGLHLMATLTNQIDHVAVKSKYRRSVLDVRTMRGADINSDRELVVAS